MDGGGICAAKKFSSPSSLSESRRISMTDMSLSGTVARALFGSADGFAHGLLRVAIDEHDVLPRIDVRVEPTRGAEQRAARRVAVVHARGGPARVLHPDA